MDKNSTPITTPMASTHPIMANNNRSARATSHEMSLAIIRQFARAYCPGATASMETSPGFVLN